MNFTPANWYWIVAGSTSQVWSSAAAAYVPVTNAGYVAWLAAGNHATTIESEASLQAVLAVQYPAGWPASPAQKAGALMAAGLIVTSTSGAWTSTFPVITDATGTSVWTLVLSELAALNLSGGATFADGAATVNWPDASGTLRTLSTTQFPLLAKAMGLFVAQARNYGNLVSGATLPPDEATIA